MKPCACAVVETFSGSPKISTFCVSSFVCKTEKNDRMDTQNIIVTTESGSVWSLGYLITVSTVKVRQCQKDSSICMDDMRRAGIT
jgi:hypothetical protein